MYISITMTDQPRVEAVIHDRISWVRIDGSAVHNARFVAHIIADPTGIERIRAFAADLLAAADQIEAKRAQSELATQGEGV